MEYESGRNKTVTKSPQVKSKVVATRLRICFRTHRMTHDCKIREIRSLSASLEDRKRRSQTTGNLPRVTT